MDIYLDSTNEKRIDLCTAWSGDYITERRFVVTAGNSQKSFNDFVAAVNYYFSVGLKEKIEE